MGKSKAKKGKSTTGGGKNVVDTGSGGGGRYGKKQKRKHRAGGKFRKRNTETRQKNDETDQQNMGGGILKCASISAHTCSVVVRHVPYVDADDSEMIHTGGNSDKDNAPIKKKGKSKRMKKMRLRPVVVSAAVLPPPEVDGEQDNAEFEARPMASVPVVAASVEDASNGGANARHAPPGNIAVEHFTKPRWSQLVPVVHVRPLIVLDLNGILCRRVRYDRIRQEEAEEETRTGIKPAPLQFRKAIGHVAGTPVIARTDLWPMLSFLDGNFTLAVWSSAKVRTAKLLIQMLFPPDIAQRLLFVWGQDRCDVKTVNLKDTTADSSDETGGKKAEDVEDATVKQRVKGADSDSIATPGTSTASCVPSMNTKTIFGKNLGKIWGTYPLWDETNTLLIDDSPEKAQRWTGNTLHPPPMMGTATEDDTCEEGNPDLSNAIGQRVFFQKLVEYWQSKDMHATDNGPFYSSLALESSDDRRQRKEAERQQLYSFLRQHGSCHMGWRGDETQQ